MSTDDRASELASLLARLAELMTERRPETATPTQTRTSPERVLLTVEEAADRLHIGKTKTYALVKSGELQSVLIGRLRRIHVDAISDYAARLVTNQQSPRPGA